MHCRAFWGIMDACIELGGTCNVVFRDAGWFSWLLEMSLVFLKFSEALFAGLTFDCDFGALARFSGIDHEQAQPGTIPP